MKKEKLVEKYIERLNDSLGLSNIKRNVENNKIYFEHNKTEYRIRMPNYKERKIIDLAKRDKYLSLVGTIPCEEDLIIKLEQSGKSIKKIKDKIADLELDKEKYQELLARETKQNQDKEDKESIDKLITEIQTIVYKQVTLAYNKAQLLSPSLENQVKDAELESIILVLFEKKQKDDWVKTYKNKEELDNEIDSELLNNTAEMCRDLGILNM